MSRIELAKSYWNAFYRGVSQPSLAALAITLAIVPLLLASFFVFFTPGILAGPGYRYFMVDAYDTHTRVTHKVLALEPTPSPLVALLGSSTTLRCFESQSGLADSIHALSGVEPVVRNLATDGQNTWEMAAIVDRLPAGQSGVIVIGVMPGILAYGTDELRDIVERPRLGFVSAILDEAARENGLEVPNRTGLYSIDNIRFLAAHRHVLLRNLLFGGVDDGDPLTQPWMKRVNNPEYWAYEISVLPRLVESFELNHKDNLARIKRFMDAARASGGYSFLILNGPYNPAWHDLDEGDAFFTRYNAVVRQFSKEQDAAYLGITQRANLKPGDFVDYEGHLGTRGGRARCHKALAETLAREHFSQPRGSTDRSP